MVGAINIECENIEIENGYIEQSGELKVKFSVMRNHNYLTSCLGRALFIRVYRDLRKWGTS